MDKDLITIYVFRKYFYFFQFMFLENISFLTSSYYFIAYLLFYQNAYLDTSCEWSTEDKEGVQCVLYPLVMLF